MKELDLQILGELKEEKKAEERIYRITQGAYQKIMTYARIASEIAGTGMECYGYLLADSESLDGVVRDAYFAPDQDAQSAYVRVSEEGVYQASKEFEPIGKYIVGWWHSHGDMTTFHSGTDDRNFLQILHSVAPQTMYRKEEVEPVLDGDVLYFDEYKLKVDDADSLKKNMSLIKKAKDDPYAFSMVVNIFGEYYLEHITKKFRHATRSYEVQQPTHPKIEFVQAEDDVTFTASELEQDIWSKINFNGADTLYDAPRHYSTEKSRMGWFERLWYGKPRYQRQIESFAKKASEHVNQGGKYAGFLSGFMLSDNPYSVLSGGRTGRPRKVSADKAYKNLTDVLDNLDDPIYSNGGKKIGIQEQRNLLIYNFIEDFLEDPEGKVMKYRKEAEILNECFRKAVNATNALAEYALETYTDYRNERVHKYTNLVSNIMARLDTARYVDFNEEVVNELKGFRSGDWTNDMPLYAQRRKVVDQFVHDYLENAGSGGNADEVAFLEGFTNLFSSGGDVDSFLEEKLGISHERFRDTAKAQPKRKTYRAEPVKTYPPNDKDIFSWMEATLL